MRIFMAVARCARISAKAPNLFGYPQGAAGDSVSFNLHELLLRDAADEICANHL
jgi:hypothetical protein